MDVVLIAGLWLDGTAWGEVAPVLKSLGHRPLPLTLPGQGDGATSATLDDQVRAVAAAVDAASSGVMVVGHSAAATLAWMAADVRPDKVARVVMIGGLPAEHGKAYFDALPVDGEVLAFPGWEVFEGPDTADLDASQRATIAANAIPVPEGVVHGIVRLGNERRFEVPVTLVCPEFSTAQARVWIDTGAVPELRRSRHVELVDLDSGHWPMFSRPVELAELLGSIALA